MTSHPTPASAMDMPGWNTSTMCIQTLRDRMHRHGWGHGPTIELPVIPATQPLPRRPLDLGVGWWR